MKNPISNFIRSVKEIGWKETYEKIKYNYAMLDTPEQLLKKELFGYFGAMMGTLIGLYFLIAKGFWYISIPVAFSMLIMYAQFKGKLKQLTILKNMDREIRKQLLDEEKKGGK